MTEPFKKYRMLVYVMLIIIGGVALYWYVLSSKEPHLDNRYYQTQLDSISEIRKQLRQTHAGIKRVQQQFITNLRTKLFPYWYGTSWDFNGTTQIPNQGSIACGYFVTTTLRDMGIPINRVKMAQCASEEMIRSLTSKKHIHYLSHHTLKEVEDRLKLLGPGIYIIGLDNHTGFISVSEEGIFFIHASGWFPFKVVKDKLSESSVIGKSRYRVVGKISDDESFLKKWISS